MLDNTIKAGIILREPIGVVGQIVPWNFPFLMAAWKLAPVLASGCCTVLKPSKTTSLSVLYFADLIKDILPPGVFNVITGAGSKAGQYMLDHKGFCKLAFTGSTEVGLSVAKATAKNSSRLRSGSAANPRTSSSRTATSNKLMMVPSSASSSIRDRSAARVLASSSRRISMTNLWQSSSTASIKSRLACRGKTRSSVRQSIKPSSIRFSPMSDSRKKKVRPSPAAVNGQLTVRSKRHLHVEADTHHRCYERYARCS